MTAWREEEEWQTPDTKKPAWAGLFGTAFDGAEGETRTLTPRAPEPKSGASTNFATSARVMVAMTGFEPVTPAL